MTKVKERQEREEATPVAVARPGWEEMAAQLVAQEEAERARESTTIKGKKGRGGKKGKAAKALGAERAEGEAQRVQGSVKEEEEEEELGAGGSGEWQGVEREACAGKAAGVSADGLAVLAAGIVEPGKAAGAAGLAAAAGVERGPNWQGSRGRDIDRKERTRQGQQD